MQLTALRETSRSSLSVLASMKSRRRLGKLACCVIEKVTFRGDWGELYHCSNLKCVLRVFMYFWWPSAELRGHDVADAGRGPRRELGDENGWINQSPDDQIEVPSITPATGRKSLLLSRLWLE